MADENKLMIRVKNTFDGNIIKKRNKFISSKKNDFGIGIESVKKTAKKYDAIVEIKHTDTEFKVSVCISY